MRNSPLLANGPLFTLAGVLLLLGILYWNSPPYAPDSWAYFELSESLRSGHYTLNQLRSFGNVVPGAPATSFPPLWPLLWGFVSATSGMAERSGLLLSIVCSLAFAIVSEAIGRRIWNLYWVGLLAALMVIRLPGYWQAVGAANSIPLQMLLASLVLLSALLRESLRARDGAVLGLLAGALIMARFDMLPFAIVVGGAVALFSRSWFVTTIYAVFLGAAISPWVWMSQHYYGSWLASDNSGVALSVDASSFVRDWFPRGMAPPTVFEQPAAWFQKILHNCMRLVFGLARSPGLIGVALIVSLMGIITIGYRRSPLDQRALRQTFRQVIINRTYLVLVAFTLAAMSMLSMYILSGYLDVRYFSLLNWIIYLWFAAAVVSLWQRKIGVERMQRYAGRMCVFLTLILLITKWPPVDARNDSGFPSLTLASELSRCLALEPVDSSSRLMAMDGVVAARLSAVHHLRTSFTPSNFERTRPSDELARQFFRTFHVTHVLGTPAEVGAMFSPSLFAAVPGNCNVPLLRVVQ